MVSAGMTCVKYLLFTFNLLFVISGIIILTIGAIAQHNYANYSPFLEDNIATGPIILIVVGVIVFVVAFFGCCGAVKENHCMIITFSVLLLIIFALELAGGIAGYVLKDKALVMVEDRFNRTIAEYENNTAIKQSWDILQTDLQCCGVNGPSDWFQYGQIVNSCCPGKDVKDTCDVSDAYPHGCLERFKEMIVKNALIIGGVGIGIAVVQIVGVIFACCLAKSIRKEYETV